MFSGGIEKYQLHKMGLGQCSYHIKNLSIDLHSYQITDKVFSL